jgi:hypothetical protein
MTEEVSIGAFRFFGVWSLGFGVFWTLGAQIPNAGARQARKSQTPIAKRQKTLSLSTKNLPVVIQSEAKNLCANHQVVI